MFVVCYKYGSTESATGFVRGWRAVVARMGSGGGMQDGHKIA